jgi:hypothetical protein
MKDDQNLLNGLGLNGTLQIACPPSDEVAPRSSHQKDSYLSNEQWLKSIRSAVR